MDCFLIPLWDGRKHLYSAGTLPFERKEFCFLNNKKFLVLHLGLLLPLDAVLLSHPDTLHLGALPYAMKQLGLSAPVYATEPVHRLGLLTMYDQYLSRKQDLILLFAARFIIQIPFQNI